jgi:hypothetical protein
MCTGWRKRRLVNRLPAFGFMGCVLDTRGLWRVAVQIRHLAEGSAMALARIQLPAPSELLLESLPILWIAIVNAGWMKPLATRRFAVY